MDKTKTIFPALYSQPIIEKLALPSRAELLPQIESGELEYLEFRANVFGTGAIKNPYVFRTEDMPSFAASFEGQPYLRNHDSRDINSRDGTILSSKLENGVIVQDIRLTTRRGMIDYLEGKMDRFSVGWDYEDAICTICNSSFFGATCNHWPGQKYQTAGGERKCELLFIKPTGNETSAVNVPAVENTGIVAALDYKQEVISQAEMLAVDEHRSELAQRQAPESDERSDPAQARSGAIERAFRLAECNLSIHSGETIMNVRELLSARAEKVTAARVLASLADTENRDFSETERAEFNQLMDAAEDLGRQITVINTERARLLEAESSLAQTPDPIKPEGSKNAKIKTLAEFNALSATERMAFVKSGGNVQD
jgi:hypothetical protein